MARYVIRRLLLTVPVLIGIVLLVFVVARVLPGDPCRVLLGERATAAQCRDFNQRNGYDQPLPTQLGSYVAAVARGDLGHSLTTGKPVAELLVQRLPVTVELTFYALLFAVVVGIPLGMVAAYRRNSPADVGTMIFANLGVSVPVFVLGMFLAFIFALVLKDTPLQLPSSGRIAPGQSVMPLAQRWGVQDLSGGPRVLLDFISNIYTLNALITFQWSLLVDLLRHMVLPAIALGTIPLAVIARITRSSLLEVLGQDYVRTAHAKGLGKRMVMTRHALRNAMLPVITVIGLSLGGLLGGAVLTETIFGLAGVGLTVYESIGARDYVVIQGFTLIIAVGYMLVNLLVDVSYAYLDPRIRLT
ncbi:MAG: ABC transporter permease [Chloroflexi bacterium]|nr:ABC transporter permease [Chloroflexota bacterium]